MRPYKAVVSLCLALEGILLYGAVFHHIGHVAIVLPSFLVVVVAWLIVFTRRVG